MWRWPYIRTSAGFTPCALVSPARRRPSVRRSCRHGAALAVDPVANHPVEDRQRHQARAEDGIVEPLDRELIAEGGLRLAAHPLDLETPDHVGEGLARGHG